MARWRFNLNDFYLYNESNLARLPAQGYLQNLKTVLFLSLLVIYRIYWIHTVFTDGLNGGKVQFERGLGWRAVRGLANRAVGG